ncbi:hypothetical protein [Streptosporangium sp. NPDC049078]|uniref:hypothetical protein n=1 Tax=Streptosporangium sp. NPDC049078 TaxID=3155767 RepID=UPI0034424262
MSSSTTAARRQADRAYANRRNKLIAYGQWHPYTDAEPARTHVRTLMAYRIGTYRIAELADVPRSVICRLLYGEPHNNRPPLQRIRPDVERKLLAVQAVPANLAPTRTINATGTRRRLQALVAIGWSLRTIADRLGMSHVNVAKIARAGITAVYPATADAVTALCEELWKQQPPTTTTAERISVAKALKHAAAHGWVVLACWDDDTIDDPDATPSFGEARGRGRPPAGDDLYKRCPDCGQTKPLAEYAINRGRPGGRHGLCTYCQQDRRGSALRAKDGSAAA